MNMPDWSEAIREGLRGLNLDGSREAEIVEELAQHLGDRYSELVTAGVAEDRAFRLVTKELEGSDLLEGLRNARQLEASEPLGIGASGGTGALGGIRHDLRVAVRSIRINPAFSLTVVLMLALGVAGTTAIFSVFNGLFLRPLPFPNPDRLVDLNEAAPKWNLTQVSVSNPDYMAWTKGNSAFDGVAFFSAGGANLSDSSGLARRIQTAGVTHTLLDVLGLKPVLGRNFLPEEDRPGGAKVLLLGYDLWRSLFHGDPNVLGRIVKLDEQPYTVVGVLPREAVLPPEAEAWLPLAADPNQGGSYYLAGIGRLKPGVSMEQGKADLTRVHKGMIQSAKAYVNTLTFPTVMPLRDRYLGDFKTVIRILLGAVGVVLLIACVNIAGLMMVRGEARSREIAIRAAVGASRVRIVRQLLTESLVIAVLGGAAGVLAGKACLAGMVSLMPDDIPRWIGFGWDARFALFSIAVTGAAAMLFGLAPALQAAAVNALSCLQEASRSSMSRSRHLVLSGLVICEIALACILLVCSGLLIQAFRKVLHVDPGFRPDHVMTWRLELPDAKYPKPEQQLAAYRDLVSRLKALPGVSAASAASFIPLAGGHEGNFFIAEDARPLARDEQNPVVLTVTTLPGYFETMGMTLLKGRWFTDQDVAAHTPQVVIVNETFAKRFWPGQDPIGKRIRYASDHETPWMQVAGLARDTKHYGLDVEMRPEVFMPFTLHPESGLTLVLRSSMDAGALAAPVRETIRQMDPGLAMFQVRTMTEWLDRSLWTRRASSWLFGAFAAVAILLAVAGIYGVVSFAVSRRTREIGIRIALGARPGDVMLRVLAGGMVLLAVGLAVGLAASMAIANVLKSVLFGVSGRDIGTYGAVAGLVALVGALANSIPARRAASVDPIRALRFE
jgi:predicted permease